MRTSSSLCDFVAGCDGFHGVSRDSIPSGVLTAFERDYPSPGSILAAAPPSNDELIYAYHERGFALHSMRSPTLTPPYLQCRTRTSTSGPTSASGTSWRGGSNSRAGR